MVSQQDIITACHGILRVGRIQLRLLLAVGILSSVSAPEVLKVATRFSLPIMMSPAETLASFYSSRWRTFTSSASVVEHILLTIE